MVAFDVPIKDKSTVISNASTKNIPEGLRTNNFEYGQFSRCHKLYSSDDSSPRPVPKVNSTKARD